MHQQRPAPPGPGELLEGAAGARAPWGGSTPPAAAGGPTVGTPAWLRLHATARPAAWGRGAAGGSRPHQVLYLYGGHGAPGAAAVPAAHPCRGPPTAVAKPGVTQDPPRPREPQGQIKVYRLVVLESAACAAPPGCRRLRVGTGAGVWGGWHWGDTVVPWCFVTRRRGAPGAAGAAHPLPPQPHPCLQGAGAAEALPGPQPADGPPLPPPEPPGTQDAVRGYQN